MPPYQHLPHSAGQGGGSRMQLWTGVRGRSAPTSSLKICGTLWSRPSTARGSGISTSSGSGRTGTVRGATRWVSQQVQRIVQALRGAGVYEETADPPPPPTCYPFVIPKSSEKVSLILSSVKINKSDRAKPPTFRLDSWEDLARSL